MKTPKKTVSKTRSAIPGAITALIKEHDKRKSKTQGKCHVKFNFIPLGGGGDVAGFIAEYFHSETRLALD